MKLLRSSTIKIISETVECENGNAYSRTEKWRTVMSDYVLESVSWHDMFGEEIATHKQNQDGYFKIKFGSDSHRADSKNAIKFKELERAYKLMKVFVNQKP